MMQSGLTLPARFRDSTSTGQSQGPVVNVSAEGDTNPTASVTAWRLRNGQIDYISTDRSDQVDNSLGTILGTIKINDQPFPISVINHDKTRNQTFSVLGSDLVEILMKEICEVWGIPPEQQRLIFAGKQLQETKTISDYGIKRGSEIYMILRCRGG
ncbi:ubiquitin D [Biomphalaria glabrata]|nr:ubiquitin D [Biomphalaria glabrata]